MQTQRKAILQLKDVTKIYVIGDNRLRALDHLSLDIYEGEFLCICGRSGSGKSTMLNMMAGLEPPTRGEIVLNGTHIERMSEGQLVRFRLKNVGFIFQQFNLFGYMTALENVTMPLVYRGVGRAERKKRARATMEAVGLATHMNHKPSEMSGGQQQRVGIARALVSGAPLLFADEPTGNLDSKTSDEVLGLIRSITKASGCTLVMVTHDPEVAQMADRVVYLLDGRITQIQTPEHPPEDAQTQGDEMAQEDQETIKEASEG